MHRAKKYDTMSLNCEEDAHMLCLAPKIYQIPAASDPLSADVFIIEGDTRYYVFDVGSNDEAFEAMSTLDKPVTVILSHFHRDHTGNMSRIAPVETLAGARTMKYIPCGTLVDAPVLIRDGVEIIVQPCVSPHAPGCLIATVDGMYTFVGDLHYARPGTGQGEAKGMLNLLKALDTRYFVVSHAQGSPLVEKSALLQSVKAYFAL